MNNFDDIFDTAVPGEQPFDKDAWAERKQAERQAVYELADTTAADVCADGGKFHAYGQTSNCDVSERPRHTQPHGIQKAKGPGRPYQGLRKRQYQRSL